VNADGDSYEVEAAGGVVLREAGEGVEVVLVHRPRYDDWSLPKGKLERGESFEAAALREIEEETGLRCRLGDELAPATYTDHKGRSKIVRWYRMELSDAASGAVPFEPNDEVDELRWLSPAAAAELVDYEHDRLLLRGIATAQA
jgi:8-oxo-dGTP diphosphatase